MVHALFPTRSKAGFETIMMNCNPETVSTDYDTSSRLYFEPITVEDVLNVIDAVRASHLLCVRRSAGNGLPAARLCGAQR